MVSGINSRCVFVFALLLTSVGLIGCGGGGGGSSSASGKTTVAPQSSAAMLASSSQSSSSLGFSSAYSSMESSVSSASFGANTELLTATATASGDLYVDPQFTFESTKEIELRVFARDEFGQPLAGKRLDVYALPDGVVSLESDDAQSPALLLSAYTDTAGSLYHRLEVPVTLQQIKLQLDAIGIEAQALVALDRAVIEHQF